MTGVSEGQETARGLLAAALPDRWAHTQGVAAQARTLTALLGAETDTVEAAAWLHDIGYSPDLAITGFHALDGARYLRDRAYPEAEAIGLVAHHSCAMIEAEERALLDVLLQEFPRGDVKDHLLAALTYCDMTTGPTGLPLAVDERLAEIRGRYPAGSVVERAIARAAPLIREQCHSVIVGLAKVRRVAKWVPPSSISAPPSEARQ